MNIDATQSPDFSCGVKELLKIIARISHNSGLFYNVWHSIARRCKFSDSISVLQEIPLGGKNAKDFSLELFLVWYRPTSLRILEKPCGKLSGPYLCWQVPSGNGPGLGHEGESVRNPLDLSMGRVKM